jgi:Uma2 family endonuclease
MVVITSPDAIPAVRLTVDEYLQADLPEGYRYEFVDGEVVMPPNSGGLHEELVYALSAILFAYDASHRGTIALISANSGVYIPGPERLREPDLAVYTRWGGRELGWAVWKQFTPVLVIEVVSPDQAHRDYHEKREDYFKAAVGECWIVDPDKEQITCLHRGENQWEEAVYRRGASFTSKCLPGLTVDVDAVLPKPA